MGAAMKSTIVEAVGTSVGGSGGKGLGAQIEAAMAQVIHDISAESEAIWNDPLLPIEEKNAKLAELNAPENVKVRKLEVRDKLKAEAARVAAEVAAAAKAAVEPKKDGDAA